MVNISLTRYEIEATHATFVRFYNQTEPNSVARNVVRKMRETMVQQNYYYGEGRNIADLHIRRSKVSDERRKRGLY